ncbi:serine/threonine protein kinase [Actinomyces bowdenii]|uniref:serine/threonine-protein kinase n=1 Tax=Actinomyces bowdenii TaxID=131109 RepID=UPI001ABC6E4D|nr:serine/threonine-protein kinase [Actinomyces bowdenii]MBO3725490.1 serine/threonine protein kinase [Actinomyces bowdenii]
MTQHPDARGSGLTMLSGLRAGTHLGGYRLLRRLGAGGMGVVWEVVDDGGRHVAMKILHPQIAADPMARRRLDREAAVLARVRDTRVARILDIETGDGEASQGVTFVITELVDGPTLQHEVDHEGVYDLGTDARDLADLAHGLVTALRAVHSAGVIHRDLKPSNVMLGAHGPVLIDFGIAQVADDVRLTQTGQVTGTPGFIPPEMLDGGEPTPEVDWYACAGVLLFTVTGRAPFGSGPWQAVFRRVYAGTPELGSLEQDCPALARAFTAALAPRVEDRLSPEGLLAVLDEIAEGGSGQEAVLEALGPQSDDGPAEDDPAAYGQPASHPGAGYGYAPASGAPSASTGSPAAADGKSPSSGAYGYIGSPGTRSSSAASAPSAQAPAPPQAPPATPPRITPTSQQLRAPAPPPSIAPHTAQRPTTPPQGLVPPEVSAPPSSGFSSGAQASYPGAYSNLLSSAYTPAPGTTGGYMAAPAISQPIPQPPPVAVPLEPRPGTAALPQWAQEPRRHPGVIAAIGALVLTLGNFAPFWMMIILTVVVVLMGTVGRAQDARRWSRLQRGSVSPGDTSRMWAASPWYFLRSLMATAFGAAIAAVVTTMVMISLMNRLGLPEGQAEPTVLVSWSFAHRMIMALICWELAYLVTLWFIPWGTPARRGAAALVELVAPSRGARLLWINILLISALVIAFLRFTGIATFLTMGPLW